MAHITILGAGIGRLPMAFKMCSGASGLLFEKIVLKALGAVKLKT
jgi:hypothetical protein